MRGWLRLLPAIEHARRLGLGITIHAGEAVDEGRMLEEIDAVAPDRIGHGTALRGEQAYRLFARRNLHVEACPTSNVVLGYLRSAAEHPLLQGRSLRGSLNTDDRTFFSSTLSGEITSLVAQGCLNIDEVARFQCQAAADAFARDHPAALSKITAAWGSVEAGTKPCR